MEPRFDKKLAALTEKFVDLNSFENRMALMQKPIDEALALLEAFKVRLDAFDLKLVGAFDKIRAIHETLETTYATT